MSDPRQPQSVPPIPQRPPQQVQPLRPMQQGPMQQGPGQPIPRIPQVPSIPRPPQSPQSQPAMRPPPQPAQSLTSSRPAPAPINPHAGDAPLDLDPIEMEEADDAEELEPAPTKNKITFGADGHLKKHAYTRKTTATGQGACRVKTFHGKLSDQGL